MESLRVQTEKVGMCHKTLQSRTLDDALISSQKTAKKAQLITGYKQRKKCGHEKDYVL